MNRTVKTPANAASAQPQAVQADAAAPGRTTAARAVGAAIASAARKNVPITKTVMNVDSLVAKRQREQRADQRGLVALRGSVEEAEDRRRSARA